MSFNSKEPTCAICHEPTLKLPISLPCQHHYCFLCIKSVLDHDPAPCCPLCRQPITITSNQLRVDHRLLGDEEVHLQHTYYWQYQGRNFGWWNYQSDMSDIIETAYRTYLWKEREKAMDQEYELDQLSDLDTNSTDQTHPKLDHSQYQIQIVNTSYLIDFTNQLQINEQQPYKKRSIRRVNQYDDDTKGTAGLRNYF